MTEFRQIRSAEEIAALSDYCAISIRADEPAAGEAVIRSVSVLQISDREVLNEAYLPIRYDDTDSDSTYSAEEVASGLRKLFPGNILVAEPASLLLLRRLLDDFSDDDMEILFVPVGHLVSALFPTASGLESGDPEIAASAFSLKVPNLKESLQPVYLEANLFENCREILNGKTDGQLNCRLLVLPPQPGQQTHAKHITERKVLSSVSDETLKHWAKTAWTASPWVIAALAIAAVILALILFPRSSSKAVDRNVPPVSYIVLTWDETGKYGTQPKKGSFTENPIEFRIPYGVYRVQNNNSIPVELHILDEDQENESKTTAESASAEELSSDPLPEDDEEQQASNRVVMRPNSDRQITIDEGQYLTLSEDATDLILFYVSAVPEEPESDTTGQVAHGQTVVYAYVKGTEVRFRRAPSLEGQIIDTLNNGQQVQVLAISGEWTHVQVQDQKGYIFSQYLTTDDPNQKKSSTEEAAAEGTETPQPDSETPPLTPETADDTSPTDSEEQVLAAATPDPTGESASSPGSN